MLRCCMIRWEHYEKKPRQYYLYRQLIFLSDLQAMQDPAVSILYDAMYQLTTEPGRFDSIARQLTIDLNAVIKGNNVHEQVP